VVSCSGENFKETASLFSLNIYWILAWWSMLFSRTWDILIAKFLGKKVILFPNSVGPFRTWVGRFLSRLALNNCDCVLVRESISFDIVKSLKINSRKALTSDTSLLFPQVQNTPFANPSDPVVGVCLGIYSHILSEEKVNEYVIAHARALDDAIEKYGFSIVFLPHYVSGFHHDDLEMSQLILGRMRNKDRVRIVNVPSVDEFRSLLGQMNMVISSKMHPAVFATSQYVPTLCIAYDQKQTGYFERLSMIDCVISVREVSYKDLLSKIGYVWNRREKIAASLREVIPALKEETKEAIKLALSPFL
jgi:colanic acid/amylovoran biosynthesis protein